MSWIFLGILSHIFWGTANVLDKYIIENKIKNVFVIFVLIDLLGLTALFFMPLFNFTIPSWNSLRWILLASASYTAGIILYFKALKIEEVSRINIWWNLIPVFTLGFGWFFINEILNGRELFGMAFLIGGALAASIHFNDKKKIAFRALILISLACVASACYAVAIRFASGEGVNFGTIFVIVTVMKFLLGLGFFVSSSFRRDFGFAVKTNDGVFWIIIGFAVIFDTLGMFFNQWALSRGPAALVFSLEGFQALFVLGLSALIARYNHSFLDESIDRKNIMIKLGASVSMIVGLIILYQS